MKKILTIAVLATAFHASLAMAEDKDKDKQAAPAAVVIPVTPVTPVVIPSAPAMPAPLATAPAVIPTTPAPVVVTPATTQAAAPAPAATTPASSTSTTTTTTSTTTVTPAKKDHDDDAAKKKHHKNPSSTNHHTDNGNTTTTGTSTNTNTGTTDNVTNPVVDNKGHIRYVCGTPIFDHGVLIGGSGTRNCANTTIVSGVAPAIISNGVITFPPGRTYQDASGQWHVCDYDLIIDTVSGITTCKAPIAQYIPVTPVIMQPAPAPAHTTGLSSDSNNTLRSDSNILRQ